VEGTWDNDERVIGLEGEARRQAVRALTRTAYEITVGHQVESDIKEAIREMERTLRENGLLAAKELIDANVPKAPKKGVKPKPLKPGWKLVLETLAWESVKGVDDCAKGTARVGISAACRTRWTSVLNLVVSILTLWEKLKAWEDATPQAAAGFLLPGKRARHEAIVDEMRAYRAKVATWMDAFDMDAAARTMWQSRLDAVDESIRNFGQRRRVTKTNPNAWGLEDKERAEAEVWDQQLREIEDEPIIVDAQPLALYEPTQLSTQKRGGRARTRVAVVQARRPEWVDENAFLAPAAPPFFQKIITNPVFNDTLKEKLVVLRDLLEGFAEQMKKGQKADTFLFPEFWGMIAEVRTKLEAPAFAAMFPKAQEKGLDKLNALIAKHQVLRLAALASFFHENGYWADWGDDRKGCYVLGMKEVVDAAVEDLKPVLKQWADLQDAQTTDLTEEETRRRERNGEEFGEARTSRWPSCCSTSIVNRALRSLGERSTQRRWTIGAHTSRKSRSWLSLLTSS
jgi:hypothetical protein